MPTPLGVRFVQYSSASGTSIINAYLQTLIGLYDHAGVSRNPIAAQLFDAGNAGAIAEVPSSTPARGRSINRAWRIHWPTTS